MKKRIIKAANMYRYVDDLWIIACYFNSHNYDSKKQIFEFFIDKIHQSKLNYLVIECAFGQQPFTLSSDLNIIRINATDIMWQKERLLNIALSHLPEICKKIAWVDCDILFESATWAFDTSQLLEKYKVVQPFEYVIRLPRHHTFFKGAGDIWSSFAAVYKKLPNLLLEGNFANHGHTGFAWASHKSILEKHLLYDACIAGSGDHVMAHAFCGDWDSPCIHRVLANNQAFYRHFKKWATSMYDEIAGSVTYSQGTILHLWHGNMENRRYHERQKTLANFGYDPKIDLKIGSNGAWRWAKADQKLKTWAYDYFGNRKEDGE